MDIKKVIKQLEDLKNDCEDFVSIEPTHEDIQALEIAIKLLKDSLLKKIRVLIGGLSYGS